MISELLSRRLVLVTGKGGVGKSTVAAALAVVAARRGRRAVVCEVDEPSAVAALLGGPASPGHAPAPAGHGVFLSVLSPDAGLRAYIGEKIRVPGLVDLALDHPAVSRFFRAAPGFAEMGVLHAIHRLLEEKDREGRPAWDHVFVDLPASGHAMAMLEAPRTGKRVFLAGPVRALCETIEQMLADPHLTACALVTLPEELPVNEAVDLAGKLGSLHIPVRAVIATSVPPMPLLEGDRPVLDRLGDGPLVRAARTGALRSERARAMLDRLAHAMGEEVLEIPFRSQRGTELVPTVADVLEAARRPAETGRASRSPDAPGHHAT